MTFYIRNICFAYDGTSVIKDISLDLEPGHFYGIMGPNGCGKTTLIDLLMGHKAPLAGTISYKGTLLSAYSRRDLAQELALVPQNFYINFPFTTQEIVIMGRYPYIPRFAAPCPEDMEIVRDAMEKTGITAFENSFVTQLSGGERQRVVFARALAQNTPVLMLDEATSNMDIRHTLNLLNILADDVEKNHKTVIAVFQDINMAAAYCDRMILMKNAQVSAFGNTADVLTEDNIRDVFGVESKVYFEPYSESWKVSFKPN